MGALVAKAYPTKLFLKLADHTYVECGSGGKSWGCWGGKTGGKEIVNGHGSTYRSNLIAEPNERAGIKIYLVHGVCHQAANRILFPAESLVESARGYKLSESLFGPYGRIAFNDHFGVVGELDECASKSLYGNGGAVIRGGSSIQGLWKARERKFQKSMRKFQDSVLDLMSLNVKRFMDDALNVLGEGVALSTRQGLRNAKSQSEAKLFELEVALTNRGLLPIDFVKEFNKMTEEFQDDLANFLGETQYFELIGESRDERLLLANPESLDQAFGEGTALAVYGSSPRG